ncbi:sensor histidine kinase [Salinibacterium sp. ZJ450]|uniref:sensor histidine kinase n=1 Tax=Salinibacterium sp. ZJ450 TaxID=2708338 RepID=UPI00141DB3D5|nr:sensor histidine kinase [Salinibacterium sp. ZJ450]
MQTLKWWHVVFSGVPLLLVLVVLLSAEDPAHGAGAVIALALVPASWFAFGRRSFQSRAVGVTFFAVLLVLLATAISFSPNTAILQALAFPFAWTFSRTRREVMVTNVLVAVAVGSGFFLAFGQEATSVPLILLTMGFSFALSMAIGFWISSVEVHSAERGRLLEELTAAQEQLAVLHRDAGATFERERMARELHDTLAQSLTGIVMLVQSARRDADVGDLERVRGRLELLEESARESLVETRTLVAAGVPVAVDGGIVPALRRLAARFERETGVTVDVDADTALPTLARDREVVLLRCSQESLANVRKHAHASSVRIALREHEGEVTLTVRDDGVGIARHSGVGFGLPGMRDRLGLVGGSLDVASDASGTVLTMTMPGGVAVAGEGVPAAEPSRQEAS